MQVNPPKKGAHLKEDINISKEKYVLDEPVALELTKMNLNGTILIQKSMEPLISGVRPDNTNWLAYLKQGNQRFQV